MTVDFGGLMGRTWACPGFEGASSSIRRRGSNGEMQFLALDLRTKATGVLVARRCLEHDM